MPQLDNYLVTLGVKGQDIVLATMNQIRKSGKDLSKSKVVTDLTTKAGKGAAKTKAIADVIAKAGKSFPEKTTERESEKKRKSEDEKNKKPIDKFSKAIDRFGNTTTNFVQSASHLDPASMIGSGLSSLAKMTIAGIPFAIAGAGFGMATNMVNMTKTKTAEQRGLTQRNVTSDYYGGKIKQIPRVSNEEQAALSMTVGGSYGKIQQPLADAINKLSPKSNTQALGRVASGNWQSTGTDKGWMLQQLSDSFSNLPPSIAQKFQASLLNKHGAGEIQKATAGEEGIQRANAKWQNKGEEQTAAIVAKIYDPKKDASGMTNFQHIFEMNDKLQSMQVNMVAAGANVAAALNTLANAIKSMMSKVQVGK